MADNTFNFDLDAPAVPTLTLDPAPAQEQAQPKQPEPAAAPEAQVKLSPEEQAMVDQFAEKIDITNSQKVLPARRPQDQVQQGRDQRGEYPGHAGGPSGAAAQGHRHAGQDV